MNLGALGTVTVDLAVPTSAESNGTMTTGTVSFRHPPDAYGTAKRHGSSVVVPTITTPGVPVGATVKLKPLIGPQITVAASTIPGLTAALSTLIATATATVNSGLVGPAELEPRAPAGQPARDHLRRRGRLRARPAQLQRPAARGLRLLVRSVRSV